MAKKDWLILAGVLLAAAVLFFATRTGSRPSGARVTVYVNDEVYCEVSARQAQDVTVDQGDGKVNVIRIDASGVKMLSSTCRNQICVHTGTVNPQAHDDLLLNNWIVCLPNGVSVEVSGAEDEG